MNDTIATAQLADRDFAAVYEVGRRLRFVYLGISNGTMLFRSADQIPETEYPNALDAIMDALLASDDPAVKAEIARANSVGLV